jgi:hypothetical protein
MGIVPQFAVKPSAVQIDNVLRVVAGRLRPPCPGFARVAFNRTVHRQPKRVPPLGPTAYILRAVGHLRPLCALALYSLHGNNA